MKIFNTPETISIQDAVIKMETELNGLAPVLYVHKGSIGNDHIMLFISFEKKSEWKHGIAENSNYIRVMVDDYGVVECFTRSLYKRNKPVSFENRLPVKTRMATVKTVDAAIAKVKKYITDIDTQLSIIE